MIMTLQAPPQSPSFFIRESAEYELVKHGDEREAGAYGKEKSEAGPFLPFPSFPAHPLSPATVSSESQERGGVWFKLQEV